MRLACLTRLAALGVVSGALACGGNGGGTTPPGPPVDLLKTPAGDNQSWYFNNPLPTALSVTAVDVDGRAVPGVVITWAVTTGDGAVTPTQSTTKNTGIASTTDSVGSATLQRVSATFSGLAGPATFTEAATTPHTTATVSVEDDHFNPQTSVVQTGGSVTWNWTGTHTHNLTFTFGPTPLPANRADGGNGTTAQRTITAVGTYNYTCTNHAGMNGTVTVVH